MIVVAVDAATDRLSVAAGSAAGPIVERTAAGARRHAGLLVSFVGEALAELGLGLADVGAVAVSDGPGSFTGLRVAAAWAKGFIAESGLPLYVASSLLVRARRAGPGAGLVLGAGSAMRGEWFVGAYRFGADDSVETVVPPRVARAAEPWEGPPPRAVIGDDFAEAVARWSGAAAWVGGGAGLPEAADLIRLIGVPGGAELVTDPSTWEPEYGRLAEAQVKWEREHGRALPDSAGLGG
ncbi:MAG: tRNA (adenosine(37)-N6)-threonylcarbamoyltransferase complex dimerization subunit type 1 TsaB [Gemmatimonadales bacterium]